MAFTFNWVSTPGQNNSFVNQSVNGGRARAIRDDGQLDPFNSPLYICIPPTTFQGGDVGVDTLYDFAKLIATCGLTTTVQNPAINYRGYRIPTGGALTLNGNPCGNYEYNVLPNGTTITQQTVATLFSDTNDISTLIVCRGDLTIGDLVVLKPTVSPTYIPPQTDTSPDPLAKRRLFMVVYVTGTLTFTGASSTISMTACGSDSTAKGANISTFNIPVANNLYYISGVPPATSASPAIQASGGAGGSGVNNSVGETGYSFGPSYNGNQLYTSGGGSGNQSDGGDEFSGAGGNGSCFSGGAGGGSSRENPGATGGSSFGSDGGNGASSGEFGATIGGTGNPGGSPSGNAGTGGVLIVITEQAFSAGGKIEANGVDGASNGVDQGGGASGAGLIVLIQSSSGNVYIPTTSVVGGIGSPGGNGGDGYATKYGINS